MDKMLNCEHCNIETAGARDDQHRVWAICGECLRETLEIARAAHELADDVRERRDPLTICARCRFTWPVSELSGGICPDCNLRAWEIASTREVLR